MEPTSPKGRDLREGRGFALHTSVPDNAGTGASSSCAVRVMRLLHKNVEPRAYSRSCSDLTYARVFGFSGGRGRPSRVLRANDAGSAELHEFLCKAGRAVDDPARRAEIAAQCTYPPADRYVLFELEPREARSVHYGDDGTPAKRVWKA